ncbi:hypothetical protein CDD82_4798 [Ophiocordyceps australis]|uniref:Uncharacterized protein n=1 Tax=Ophiocordyceps australis TaxID=1399860 RepID=A0A2C5Z5U2_9HYPO|nr:hypothetical protein CDD82_4798 [Ophiocordyceps australis]
MSIQGIFTTCLCALLVTGALSELGPWVPHQINVSICFWDQPRAALVGDRVYLDGGLITLSQGLDSGIARSNPAERNWHGQVYTYDLGEKLTPDTNITAILVKQQLFKNPTGASSEPSTSDGGMLANDDGFYLYGGAFSRDGVEIPANTSATQYRLRPGPNDAETKPLQFGLEILSPNVSRYIAYGAAANAPSENKAWYFSGLVRPDHGPVFKDSPHGQAPDVVSNTLITLDMAAPSPTAWSNASLPSQVKGRSNAEVVWLPIGAQGILVVLGGVTYPWWAVGYKSPDEEASKRESPQFMQVIDLFDVAGNKWYQQHTVGGPGARARGCAVVAPAKDRSSFNIYYYGGTDGLDPGNELYDDVWILSLPSFTWTQINNGTSLHARAGHKCFMPYPDQMMVFGGYPWLHSPSPSPCLEKGPLVIFNLTTGEWIDSYDPTVHDDYAVPDKVVATIGGNGAGGAQVREPRPSGWASQDLKQVFDQGYDESKIKPLGPYTPVASGNEPNTPPDGPASHSASQDKSRIIIPAVVVPVVVLIIAGIAIACWRRTANKKRIVSDKRESKDSGSDDAARIHSWIRGQGNHKPMAVDHSEATYPASETTKPASCAPMSPETMASEMPNSELVELDNTAPLAELHDSGLSPLDVIQKHSRHGRNRMDSATDPSQYSFGDSTSLASRISGTANSSRIDSPPLGNAMSSVFGAPRYSTAAGVSMSQRGPMPSMPEFVDSSRSPASVSPPTAEEAPGSDYLSVGEAPSTLGSRGAQDSQGP